MPDDTKPSEPAPPTDGAATPPAKPDNTAPEAKKDEATAPGGQAGSDVGAAGAEAAAGNTEAEILKAERDGLKDQLLRTLAEMDNLRKRTDREKSETAKFAISKFAHDIVNVGDSFQHAIGAVPADAADKDPALKSFLDGVTIAERAFLAVLERHGIRPINPMGELFNPYQHHAASEEENAAITAGTITKVYQVGYILEDRVLRPAMVVVAHGGKKPAPDAAAKAATENTAATSGSVGDGVTGSEPVPPKVDAEEKAS